MSNLIATIDLFLISYHEGKLYLYLHERNNPNEPFYKKMALVGGFIHTDKDDNMQEAANRIYKTKINHQGIHFPIEASMVVGNSYRDPRGWAVSNVYLGIIPNEECHIAIDDIKNWDLAFDHKQIIQEMLDKIKKQQSIVMAANLLNKTFFTMLELQTAFEAITQQKTNGKTFRRKVEETKVILESSKVDKSSSKRPAKLYYCIA